MSAGRESERDFGRLPLCLLLLLYVTILIPGFAPARGQSPAESNPTERSTDPLAKWEGLPVRRISFEGVAADRLTSTRAHLPQVEGSPLRRENVAASLRELYATGLFENVEAAGQREGDGVALIFRGASRTFVGTVSVDGAKGPNVNTQLERASRLNPGTRFSDVKMPQALDTMRDVMAENGFHESVISYKLTPHPDQLLTDIAIHVVSGPQARVGSVKVSGDSGMTLEEFRRYGHLRTGAPVDRDTVSRALAGVLKHYRSQNRLEAEIKLEAQAYEAPHRVNFSFTASIGPVVRVVVEGASLSQERIKRLVPVFEEGTVDEDLLNEGGRRVRDYFQSLGYFDIKVDHSQADPRTGQVLIVYNVQLGERRHVERVSVDGNHYFDAKTLEELLSVHAANALDHHGVYNQALVSADVAALQSVYQNNGFSKIKITPETGPTGPTVGGATSAQVRAARDTTAPLTLDYHIEEGQQQRVGSVKVEGNENVQAAILLGLMNTEAGQLFSPRSLAGDRDALLTDYMSRGFDQARVDVEQNNDDADASKVNVVFRVSEGKQIFVRNVILTGLHYTRPETVARAITLHAGDPLSAAAIDETQRNLYEFALFNEVNTAVVNPNGGESTKTVLLQALEARRWTLTYGAGFEVQTGTPVNGCQGLLATGVNCTPNGRTGVSPRGLIALTRNNLFGREQSASVQANYGLLEQRVDLIYQNPHLIGRKNLGLTFSGGYANSHDVTTYVASRLQAGFRFSQNFNHPGAGLSRANTLIYAYDFRRVKVAEETLQVFPIEVDTLAAAVTVGGPAFTWIRDSRDSAVNAQRGTYTTFQEFLSAAPFGAQAQFNRIDTSSSSYYGFGKSKFVLARNTRYGQERAFGEGGSRMIPLPERLYAGGATSLRGFAINAAGPRDPETGFPIGGAGALVNSTELRFPPPTLPYFGNTLSVVLFHDMGNVFNNAGDAWASILRVSQPNRDSCKILTPLDTTTTPPTQPAPHGTTDGPTTSTGHQGVCSFKYFSHAPGLGLRYHTPVGPIRLDFSYNLNPPIFPINVIYSQKVPTDNQHVGEAGHFNFFFSLGQTF